MLLSYLAFAVFLISTAMFIYTLKQNPRSHQNWAYAIVAIAEAVWAFGYIFVYALQDSPHLMSWYRLASVGFILVPSAWLYFAWAFAEREFRLKWWRAIILLTPPLIFLTANLTGQFYAEGFAWTEWGNRLILNKDTPWPWLYYVYNLYFVWAFILFVRKAKKNRSIRVKKQIRLILILNVINLLMNYSSNIFLPMLDKPVPSMGVLFNLISLSAAFIAINRYRMLKDDLDLILQEVFLRIEDAVLILDNHGRLIRMNESARYLADFQLDERPDKRMIESKNFSRALDSVIKSRKPVEHLNITFQKEAAKPIPTEAVLSPLVDRLGDLIGLVLSVRRLNVIESAVKKYGITEREKTVFLLLSQGNTMNEIADKLNVSYGTAKNHIHHIYQKTGAKNRMELIRMLFED